MRYFYAYILLCSDGRYYVGHTDDLELRFAQHQSGALGGYTYKRRPVVLKRSQTFQTRDDAKAAELQIKGWSRAKKEALIAGDWAMVQELAKCRSQNLPDQTKPQPWACRTAPLIPLGGVDP